MNKAKEQPPTGTKHLLSVKQDMPYDQGVSEEKLILETTAYEYQQ